RAAATTATEHTCHHGRRCRLVQHRRLSSRNHVGQDAKPRQARRRGHAIYRLLRRGKLYRRPSQLHHWRTAAAHRLTTVGQAGAAVGIPEQAVTLATVLKSLGYATGQFGKNHLGDLNKFLPTVHGFDEYFGYLYHLDAMSDPYWYSFPQDWIDKYGPR